MKKIFLLITTIGALLLGACSEEDLDVQKADYVTISGNWEMHVTAADGVTDSVIKHPNRILQMTWSDMTYDAATNVTTISSQATIGNGVWRLTSYILGNTAGNYTMQDSSYATYTYTTKPSSTDSLHITNYTLAGEIVWENSTDLRYGKLTYNDTKATDEEGKAVTFTGSAKSALVK